MTKNKSENWSERVSNKPKQEEYTPFGSDAQDMFESLFGKNEKLDAEITELSNELDDLSQAAMDAVIHDMESTTESA